MLAPVRQPEPPAGASFSLLGVRFRCRGVRSILTPALVQLKLAEDELAAAAADALRRQRRSRVAYWDVLTFWERSVLSRVDPADVEERLLDELRRALGTGKVPIETAKSLAKLDSLSTLAVAVLPVSEAMLGVGEAGGTPAGRESVRARRTAEPGGLMRVLTIDMEGPPDKPPTFDWPRLVTLAALAQLKTDLETWIETGYLRVRRCARDDCRSWYKAERLADRQRFCSAYCRVAFARQSRRGSKTA